MKQAWGKLARSEPSQPQHLPAEMGTFVIPKTQRDGDFHGRCAEGQTKARMGWMNRHHSP